MNFKNIPLKSYKMILPLCLCLLFILCSCGGGGSGSSGESGSGGNNDSNSNNNNNNNNNNEVNNPSCSIYSSTYLTLKANIGIANKIEIDSSNFSNPCNKKMVSVNVVDITRYNSFSKQDESLSSKDRELFPISNWKCENNKCLAELTPSFKLHKKSDYTTIIVEVDFEGIKVKQNIGISWSNYIYTKDKIITGKRNNNITFDILENNDFFYMYYFSRPNIEILKTTGGKILGNVEHKYTTNYELKFSGTFVPDHNLIGSKVASITYKINESISNIFFILENNNTPIELLKTKFLAFDDDIFTINNKIDYKDSENDIVSKVNIKNISGGSLDNWVCNSEGNCDSKVNFNENNETITLDVQLIDNFEPQSIDHATSSETEPKWQRITIHKKNIIYKNKIIQLARNSLYGINSTETYYLTENQDFTLKNYFPLKTSSPSPSAFSSNNVLMLFNSITENNTIIPTAVYKTGFCDLINDTSDSKTKHRCHFFIDKNMIRDVIENNIKKTLYYQIVEEDSLDDNKRLYHKLNYYKKNFGKIDFTLKDDNPPTAKDINFIIEDKDKTIPISLSLGADYFDADGDKATEILTQNINGGELTNFTCNQNSSGSCLANFKLSANTDRASFQYKVKNKFATQKDWAKFTLMYPKISYDTPAVINSNRNQTKEFTLTTENKNFNIDILNEIDFKIAKIKILKVIGNIKIESTTGPNDTSRSNSNNELTCNISITPSASSTSNNIKSISCPIKFTPSHNVVGENIAEIHYKLSIMKPNGTWVENSDTNFGIVKINVSDTNTAPTTSSNSYLFLEGEKDGVIYFDSDKYYSDNEKDTILSVVITNSEGILFNQETTVTDSSSSTINNVEIKCPLDKDKCPLFFKVATNASGTIIPANKRFINFKVKTKDGLLSQNESTIKFNEATINSNLYIKYSSNDISINLDESNISTDPSIWNDFKFSEITEMVLDQMPNFKLIEKVTCRSAQSNKLNCKGKIQLLNIDPISIFKIKYRFNSSNSRLHKYFSEKSFELTLKPQSVILPEITSFLNKDMESIITLSTNLINSRLEQDFEIETINLKGGSLTKSKWECDNVGKCKNGFRFNKDSLLSKFEYNIKLKNGVDKKGSMTILPFIQKEIEYQDSFFLPVHFSKGVDYDSSFDSTPNIQLQNITNGEFILPIEESLFGLMFFAKEFKCNPSGFCVGTFKPYSNENLAKFSFEITTNGTIVSKGEYILKLNRNGNLPNESVRTIDAIENKPIEISLSVAEILGDSSSKFQIIDLIAEEIRGGHFKKTFVCNQDKCVAQFDFEPHLYGLGVAGFNFRIKAKEKSSTTTIYPRFVSTILFNIKKENDDSSTDPSTFSISPIKYNFESEIANPLEGVSFEHQFKLLNYYPTSTTAINKKKFYTINNMPAWASFDSQTGILNGTPKINFLGTTADYSKPQIFTIQVYEQTQSGTSVHSNLLIAEKEFSFTIQNDPLYSYAWHLQNDGISTFSAYTGILGIDINAASAYQQGLTGKGIKIAVSDSGVQIAHPDLKDNVVKTLCKNYSHPVWGGSDTTYDQNNPVPKEGFISSNGDHGTSVAGLIGARGWNNIGSRGVAPLATIVGTNYLSYQINNFARIDHALLDVDIINQSWGRASFNSVNKIFSEYEETLIIGIKNLRNKKGVIYVKSAGNDFEIGENCNIDSSRTTPWFVVVGAINSQGYKSSYSTTGSCLWISSPGGEYGLSNDSGILKNKIDGLSGILTVDVTGCDSGYSQSSRGKNNFDYGKNPFNSECNYTSSFGGTSSAAPIASGAIALMLERNPSLTWRDVKFILAKTSKKIDQYFPVQKIELADGEYVYENGWVTNKADNSFHNWYGFGLIDLAEAIKMANPKTYTNLPPLHQYEPTWYSSKSDLSKNIPDFSIVGEKDDINVDLNIIVESVQVEINFEHPYTRELSIELISPSGTKSILLQMNNSITQETVREFRLLSNAFYGESSSGEWTLKYVDTSAGLKGVMKNWKIRFYGHKDI